MTKKIIIDPVTRVEGHGKVTIHLNDQGEVSEARFHIVEFRGFEKFVQGRPYWEAPVIVQRLCGICPVSHHLAAAKAMDQIVGADQLTNVSEKMRRLMHYGQIFQSHALHFFYLAAPDLLLGIHSDPAKRNIMGLLENKNHRKMAKDGIMLRKFGQEIIKATAGKKIHGISAVPGGIHKNLSLEERDYFFNGKSVPSIDTCINMVEELLDFTQNYYKKNQSYIDHQADFPSNHLSLVNENGEMDLYHGKLRAVDCKGKIILDDIDYNDYLDFFAEEVKCWTYLKFPYLKHLGAKKGWNRVGPLARLNVCEAMGTIRAQERLEEYRRFNNSPINNKSLYYHWARIIEMLHCAEKMKELLHDSDLQNTNLITKGVRKNTGIGVIEAPRGTLIHHYEVADDDQITRCNLIVSTTHNNEPINKSVELIAKELLTHQNNITEGMLNEIEVAIRAYDPCLSCATHAMGQMPLQVILFDNNNHILQEKYKGELL